MSVVEGLAKRIRRRILAGLHVGTLKPGDRLPSIRALTTEMGRDHRAVGGAYQMLQDEGLVEIRPRSGVYVASREVLDPGSALPPTARWVTDVVVAGLDRRIPVPELSRLFEQCTEARKMTFLCVESIADALDALSQELEHDIGLSGECFLLPGKLDDAARAELVARSHQADVVVTTVFHARMVRSLLHGQDPTGGDPGPRDDDARQGDHPRPDVGTGQKRGARQEKGARQEDHARRGNGAPRGDAPQEDAVPVIEVRINGEWLAIFRKALHEGPVTVVVKDPGFEARLRSMFAAEDTESLRVEPVEEARKRFDRLTRKGTVFLTSSARAALGEEAIPSALQNAPMLSHGTLRELAEVLVRRNVELDRCA